MAEHEKYGKIVLVDLKQRHMEAFLIATKDVDKELPLQIYYGKVLKAAIDAGWIIEPVIEDVGDVKPARVRWLAEQVITAYSESVTVDPN